MNIHIIRTKEVAEDKFMRVINLVNAFPGPMSFHIDVNDIYVDSDDITEMIFDEPSFNKKNKVVYKIIREMQEKSYMIPQKIKTVSWKTLFTICENYRKEKGLRNDEQVVLLTDLSNEHNWFAASDPSGKLNHFIQTADWEYFIPCDPSFPIAYEITSTILRRIMFSDLKSLPDHMHSVPRGCMNDFCEQKKEITLKLRTGDICPSCMEQIASQKTDPLLLSQVLAIIDSIRTQMLFRERFRQLKTPSRISIRGPLRKIYFTDLADAELKLNPLEKTVYLLFLKEEGGLYMNELHEHEAWIRETYKTVGNPRTIVEMNNSIQQLIDPTENSASEKLSRIRNKISLLTGSELATFYMIDGPRGEKKKIPLDRNLVQYL